MNRKTKGKKKGTQKMKKKKSPNEKKVTQKREKSQ